MGKKVTIEDRLNDLDYLESVKPEYKTTTVILTIDGRPESYARERKGRGKHFYNPKSDIMEKIRKNLIHQLDKETYEYTRKLIENESAEYYVELQVNYYLPIPKAANIKDTVRMIKGYVRPTVRPDLDNYGKFLLDTLHEVLYSDDKVVVSNTESKLYSTEPRTVITATITEIINKK